MKRVFGKKKATGPAPSLDDASRGMTNRISDMEAKIQACENELRVYKDKIKNTKSPAAKKQLQKRAMEVLKRKRMYEKQRDSASAQQFNLDQTSFTLESGRASIQTVAAMKAANKELRSTLRKDLDVDDIGDLADELAEMMDDFNEINDTLAHGFSTPEDLDEADLDAELDMLGGELDDLEDEVSTPSYLLPSTPNVAPGKDEVKPHAVDDYGLPSAPIGNYR